MKKFVFLFLVLSFFLTSCEKEDTPELPVVQRTVFVYMPWSTNLLSDFQNNINDMEIAIKKGILKNERVLVFLSTTSKDATLFEFQYKDGKYIRHTLKEYENPAFTTAAGITSILNDVKGYAPANSYSMIIGSHGLGWIPVSSASTRSVGQQMHWDSQATYRTRLFGGITSEFQTDITTFAKGISDAGLKMEYIMFDDCYMSCVEVAYDLKDVTHYLIGCPTEIMVHGMPYEDMCAYLFGEVDYAGICEVFLDFYQNYELMPCGTIGVTDCSELDELAAIMKEINSKYTFDTSLLNSVQIMDGYSPVIFFDLGDYVAKLCSDQDLLNKFNTQLNRTVPSAFKSHTEYFYTAVGYGRKVKINAYSGITISDISTHRYAAKKSETAWYKATH
ncbi:clostripain-related cysteine peptidase [uncultured Bacteroides sp.]|uniref:clostripain-related cysteine peptidase n=1 Tax=uncultured Bacteroides sp. TaxID=162156 RepID=UPI0025D61776|nr:clostripain-related cysteine peptidase [uncultured Bacteroides sp.]